MTGKERESNSRAEMEKLAGLRFPKITLSSLLKIETVLYNQDVRGKKNHELRFR